MSQALVGVVGRAIVDPVCREALFDDPDEALRGHEVPAEERDLISPGRFYAWVGQAVVHRLLPVRVGRRLLIAPLGVEPSPRPGDLVVRLDQRRNRAFVARDGLPVLPDGSPIPPGGAMAFGSGLHPTTRLCLGALEDHVHAGDVVLDLGTGSGVLAIAAARLGAAAALALDVDAAAVRVARDHVALNGVEQIVHVEQGSLERVLSGEAGRTGFVAHVVVANIVAPVVVRMLGDGLPGVLRPGGVLIVSGIRAEEAAKVVGVAQRAGLAVVGQEQLGGWVAVVLSWADGVPGARDEA